MDPMQFGIKLPLNCGHFISKLSFETCPLEESIARHIRLLITTSYGECRFDEEIGCEIWEHEFEHSQVSKIWIDRMALQMKNLLEKYEQRLLAITVKARVSEEEFKTERDGADIARLQKCLHLNIRGKLNSTNEPFYFNDKIYLSPFATE